MLMQEKLSNLYKGYELTLTKKGAQELLDQILEKYHLDIAEIMRDGEKIEYTSTESDHLEITVRAKEKSNA